MRRKTQDQPIVFKLMGAKKPVSWQLPLNEALYVKDVNGQKVRKKVHYIRTADSIFVEDYKGDEKAMKVFFEEGFLKVDPLDANLLKIVYGHPWHKKKYDRVDENRDAEIALDFITFKKKALAKVDIADPDERRANAVALFGNRAVDWTETRVEAELNKLADTEPERVLREMNAVDYKNKFIASYAMLKGVIEVNPTKTAVLWAADGGVIVRVAAGENPLHRLAEFLSQDSEQSQITLQTIGERLKGKYTSKRTEEEIVDELIPPRQEEEVDLTLEEATKQFEAKFEKQVPNNKKNDLDWIADKLSE